MRHEALLFTVVAGGVFLLWRQPTSDQLEPERGATGPDATEVQASATARLHRRPVSVPEAKSKPSLAVERVDFDRRPWKPDEELDTVYERRASVFEAFDRFCEETGVSDHKVQQVLMILYDYQENMRLIHEDIMADSEYLEPWKFEMRLRAASVIEYTTGVEIRHQLEDLLSPEEMRAWRRIVEDSNIWLKLSVQPMIGPAESR